MRSTTASGGGCEVEGAASGGGGVVEGGLGRRAAAVWSKARGRATAAMEQLGERGKCRGRT